MFLKSMFVTQYLQHNTQRRRDNGRAVRMLPGTVERVHEGDRRWRWPFARSERLSAAH